MGIKPWEGSKLLIARSLCPGINFSWSDKAQLYIISQIDFATLADNSVQLFKFLSQQSHRSWSHIIWELLCRADCKLHDWRCLDHLYIRIDKSRISRRILEKWRLRGRLWKRRLGNVKEVIYWRFHVYFENEVIHLQPRFCGKKVFLFSKLNV